MGDVFVEMAVFFFAFAQRFLSSLLPGDVGAHMKDIAVSRFVIVDDDPAVPFGNMLKERLLAPMHIHAPADVGFGVLLRLGNDAGEGNGADEVFEKCSRHQKVINFLQMPAVGVVTNDEAVVLVQDRHHIGDAFDSIPKPSFTECQGFPYPNLFGQVDGD